MFSFRFHFCKCAPHKNTRGCYTMFAHVGAFLAHLGVLQLAAGVMRIEVGAHLMLTQRTRGAAVPPQSPRARTLPTCVRKLGPAARVGARTVKHPSPPYQILAKTALPYSLQVRIASECIRNIFGMHSECIPSTSRVHSECITNTLRIHAELFRRPGDVQKYFKRRPNIISSFGRRVKRVKHTPDDSAAR